MAAHIPFVNIRDDLNRLRNHYSDSKMVRVPLTMMSAIHQNIPRHMGLWIDAEIDGYDCHLNQRKLFESWKNHINQFQEHEILSDPEFISKPDTEKLKRFTCSVLERCHAFQPLWITVPQLPVTADASRNRINRKLAAIGGEWKSASGFRGQLILPLVFTHQDQLKGRTQWTPKLRVARRCYNDSGAAGIWIVDSDLSDQKCRERFPRRFQCLIKFHEDLRGVFPKATIIAGPYWGMNMVLWVRRLCDFPAISLGTGYQYFISGSFRKRARRFHAALPPLRRWAVASPDLRNWLGRATAHLKASDAACVDLRILHSDLGLLMGNEEAAKKQVAKTYKAWCDKIESVPPEGRSLALYQDLSSAYVLGKQLPKLPKSEAPGRDAGKVAEQLMLQCL
jgi:hypothetical protein